MRTPVSIALLTIASVGCELGETAIPDEPAIYLASVDEDTPSEQVAFAIESTGATQNRVYPAIHVVRLLATPEQRALIEDFEFVNAVEPVNGIDGDDDDRSSLRAGAAELAAGQNLSWGVAAVGGPLPPTGRALWVLDSGIELDHPDLNVDRQRSADMVVFLGGRESQDTRHGTGVAGVAAAIDNDFGTVGVTPGALVVSVRVLDDTGRGRMDTLIAGLNYAAERAAPGDVFNLSLAARGHSVVVTDAVTHVANKQISVVLAAGNAASDSANFTPAGLSHTGVYTISAMDESGCLASFSNYGAPIDAAAPGTNIVTLDPGGGSAVYEGTSFAAPHVAGLLLAGELSSQGNICGDQDGVAEPIAHR